jgi:glucose 1-dehydrogenase
MRAITVLPGIANSARLDEVPEPPLSEGPVLVRTLALGVCATDREILVGAYGSAPPGEQRLVLGHESLGTVEAAPDDSGLVPGDLVVGIVRRPDPEPCPACAAGEWDMCRNGRYTERGIKERHGYGAERFRVETEFVVNVEPSLGMLGVLLEPASILAKAWDHIERIGRRTRIWAPRTLLVTGAGPIGLLAALMGFQRDLEDEGTFGIGQSSWGPTGFAFASSAEEANRLLESIRRQPRYRDLDIHAVSGLNRGAQIVSHVEAGEPERYQR